MTAVNVAPAVRVLVVPRKVEVPTRAGFTGPAPAIAPPAP